MPAYAAPETIAKALLRAEAERVVANRIAHLQPGTGQQRHALIRFVLKNIYHE
jgi:hypothetical protein